MRTVAGRLGHADPCTTLRVYAHALADRHKAAAAILGGLLFSPRERAWGFGTSARNAPAVASANGSSSRSTLTAALTRPLRDV